MFFTYRGYTSASGEAAITETVQTLSTDVGAEYAVRRVWSLQGQAQASDAPTTVLRMQALANAFSVWFADLTLWGDDGTRVKTLSNADSLTGVRIVQPPGWPSGGGAELTTFANYQVVADAEYPLPARGATYRSFTETLAFSGGGPRRTLVECVNAPPQPQTLYKQTIYRAQQSGQAVGLYGYPPVPPPLFPAWLMEAPQVTYGTPRRTGDTVMEFPVSWAYTFAAPGPLSGRPGPVPRK